MTPKLYIRLVLLIKSREEEYHKINRELIELQGDFPTHVQCFDMTVLEGVVNVLDDLLEELTGINELASYYLWGAPEKGYIETREGYAYTWTCGEEFEKAVYQMIKDKKG